MSSSKRPPRRASGDGVLVLGEVLCDMFPPKPGVSFVDAPTLTPLLGGAPANVAVQLARKGMRAGLISAVGTDPLGARLLAELAREGVDVAHVERRAGYRTGVTLVEVDERGERRFYPLVDKRADLALTAGDVKPAYVRSFAAVHTGTVGLRAPGSRAAYTALLRAARAAKLLVSLDVNLRWAMYASREELLGRARMAVTRAHVVKATRDEARALLDASARVGDRGLAERLLSMGPRLVLLTLDVEGALLVHRHGAVHVDSPAIDVVDATGAGDAFVGAALARLLTLGVGPDALDALDEEALAAVGRDACRAGALTCTALGATTAMPRD